MKDQKTFRELRHTRGAAEVDQPEWAQQYAVGEEIAFEAPPDGEIMTAPVAGFSCKAGNEGLPVIVCPDELQQYYDVDVGTIAIEEECHVPHQEVES